jgi:hypothetical protein
MYRQGQLQIANSTFKGKCQEIFDLFFHQTKPTVAMIHRLKPFWIPLRIRRDIKYFRTQISCILCQWHSMHGNILLCSPFKFIYFCSDRVGQFANIYFLLDIPFKGCQGRSNRSSIVHVHAVSYFACAVIDTALGWSRNGIFFISRNTK